ncbi:COX15/CtaA family protein [Litorivicinus lipolyticus]|uniref:COX15/CtaA family protein n=1 Tax=Litorivicinus lipolyticus TaxID=418701 RepID=UPI003B5AB60C
MTDTQRANTLTKLAVIAVFFALIVIGKGAYTRLADAGLGCPDWPGCYGHLTVPSGDKVVAAELAFPDAPVESYKAWVEMIHRYLATALGLLIIVITVLGLKWAPAGKSSGWPRKHLIFLLLFVCLQGAFGAWTVTLKLWPKIVTLHLLGGFTVLTLLSLAAIRFSRWRPDAGVDGDRAHGLRALLPMGWVAMAVLCTQIFLGGWTSTNYAALACPDLPTCQGEMWPETDFQSGFNLLQEIGPNYLGGKLDNASRIAIHQSHRIGAIVATLVISGLALALIRRGRGTVYGRLGQLMLVALSVQIALGLSNIWFQLPIAVATAHNLGAAILLQVLVFTLYALRKLGPNGWSEL